ncbi:MAG: signal recognition particle protein [Anaerosomatales bacterium]|nr:signal recognition particle protein [Anaerosomatales bacterium]MDT8433405.1 signal recognition particle protein [Anaerosomatales bacterium]
MFENLSQRLQSVFAGLTGKGRLSEADVDAAMREIRLALLEADVNFRVVKEFVARVRERAVGADVAKSLTPGQMVIRIVMEELTELLGGTDARLVFTGRIPGTVMLVGLQGSGKTTASAKLANILRKQGKRPLLVAGDVYRPAAIDQLEALGRELDIPVYRGESSDPVEIARAGVKEAVAQMRDVVIIDTAGRLHVDEEMMTEAARIKDAVRPDQILMVVDAMTGQDAVTAAQAFSERVDFDAVIVTKLDGDARGGAALSVKHVTGKPIMFAGVGEKLDALEPFHPDRMAKRILGMGDVVSLIEKAAETADTEMAEEMEERLRRAEFTFDDFLNQLRQVKKMGGIGSVLKMLPGAGQLTRELDGAEVDERQMDRVAAIIQSMTAKERANPKLLNGSRRERIARGAGVTVYDVNQLVKQFQAAKKLMKQFQARGGGKGRRGTFRLPGGMQPPF